MTEDPSFAEAKAELLKCERYVEPKPVFNSVYEQILGRALTPLTDLPSANQRHEERIEAVILNALMERMPMLRAITNVAIVHDSIVVDAVVDVPMPAEHITLDFTVGPEGVR
jgi:hypothetical protein